jgi:hypothetical protein
MYECTAYIPDMSGQDSKRAAIVSARPPTRRALATATEAEQLFAGYRRRHCDAIRRSGRLRDASRHTKTRLVWTVMLV